MRSSSLSSPSTSTRCRLILTNTDVFQGSSGVMRSKSAQACHKSNMYYLHQQYVWREDSSSSVLVRYCCRRISNVSYCLPVQSPQRWNSPWPSSERVSVRDRTKKVSYLTTHLLFSFLNLFNSKFPLTTSKLPTALILYDLPPAAAQRIDTRAKKGSWSRLPIYSCVIHSALGYRIEAWHKLDRGSTPWMKLITSSFLTRL